VAQELDMKAKELENQQANMALALRRKEEYVFYFWIFLFWPQPKPRQFFFGYHKIEPTREMILLAPKLKFCIEVFLASLFSFFDCVPGS
jgi:hypothetical protein